MSDIDIPLEARLKYLERRQVDLEACQKAVIEKNFEVLKRIGHQIKGNAATFGYDDLGLIAIDLEQCALQEDLDQLQSVLNRFSDFMSRTTH